MSGDHCDFGPFLPVGGDVSRDQSTLISNGSVGIVRWSIFQMIMRNCLLM